MDVHLEDVPLIVIWMSTWYMPWLVYSSVWPQRRNPTLCHAPPMRLVVPATVSLSAAFSRPLLSLLHAPCWLHLMWVFGMIATSAWVLVLEGRYVVTVHATTLLYSYTKWNQLHFKKMYRCRRCLHPSAQRCLLLVLLVILLATSCCIAATTESFLAMRTLLLSSPQPTDRAVTLATTWPWLAMTMVSSTLLHQYHSADYFEMFRRFMARAYIMLALLAVHVAVAHATPSTDTAWQSLHVSGIIETLVAETSAYFLLRATSTLIRYGTSSRRVRAALTTTLPAKSTRQLSKSMEMFAAFLDSPDGFEAFRSYCFLELRLEDVLAFQLCQEFRRGQSHSLFAAQHVYQQCVSAMGPLTTPAAATWRRGLRSKLHKITPFEVGPTMFDPLAHDLVHDMYTQVFPRFCRHPFGRSWKWFAMRSGSSKKIKPTRADDRMKALSTYLVRQSIDESNESTTSDTNESSI